MKNKRINVTVYDIKNVIKKSEIKEVELQKRDNGYICFINLTSGISSYIWRRDKEQIKSFSSADAWLTLFNNHVPVNCIKVVLKEKNDECDS